MKENSFLERLVKVEIELKHIRDAQQTVNDNSQLLSRMRSTLEHIEEDIETLAKEVKETGRLSYDVQSLTDKVKELSQAHSSLKENFDKLQPTIIRSSDRTNLFWTLVVTFATAAIGIVVAKFFGGK